MKKIWFGLFTLLILATLNLTGRSQSPADETLRYEKIHIVGEDASLGIYDPSLQYYRFSNGDIGYMVYSAVNKDCVSTSLAKSIDNGKTWEKIKTINPCTRFFHSSIPECSTPEAPCIWQHEVPTLVYDPADINPNKRWKLFWHKYLLNPSPKPGDDNRMFQYGWIAYKYAPTPEYLSGAAEIRLFGGEIVTNAGITRLPLPPFTVKYNLSRLHPALNGLSAYTEPGSIVMNGVLYLSLQGNGFSPGLPVWQKQILIASHDHGETWKYAGEPVTDQDANYLGHRSFTQSNLAEESGRIFVFYAAAGHDDLTRGTYIFEFADISRAALKRDSTGKLIVVKYLGLGSGSSGTEIHDGGSCGYDDRNTYGGVVMGQTVLNVSDYYQIWNTRIRISDKADIYR